MKQWLSQAGRKSRGNRKGEVQESWWVVGPALSAKEKTLRIKKDDPSTGMPGRVQEGA